MKGSWECYPFRQRNSVMNWTKGKPQIVYGFLGNFIGGKIYFFPHCVAFSFDFSSNRKQLWEDWSCSSCCNAISNQKMQVVNAIKLRQLQNVKQLKKETCRHDNFSKWRTCKNMQRTSQTIIVLKINLITVQCNLFQTFPRLYNVFYTIVPAI